MESEEKQTLIEMTNNLTRKKRTSWDSVSEIAHMNIKYNKNSPPRSNL
jgi:hypothetical protein